MQTGGIGKKQQKPTPSDHREDRLSISHTLSPPTLASVCNESNDGEYWTMLVPLYHRVTPMSRPVKTKAFTMEYRIVHLPEATGHGTNIIPYA
jgi:hypothetical protein